jgi:hypothetical protein
MQLGGDQIQLYAHICTLTSSRDSCVEAVRVADLEGWAYSQSWSKNRLLGCVQQLVNLKFIKGDEVLGYRPR